MPFHLLVVEDSTADARLIRLGVARCTDCTAAFAEDGDVALALLRRHPPFEKAARPDLILLDLNLPRLSGHELLVLLSADADLKSIPVVVFSGSPNPSDHARATANGAAAFVVKPGQLEPFVDAVAAVVLGWMEKKVEGTRASSIPAIPIEGLLENGDVAAPGAEPLPDPN
ncbi:MAG TPA: response regulator [Candidatus Polarisedimenticolaceae bacterium]|nr:response regulator [Candidatus Polarisedimenticolaceae bacterium]